MVLGTRLPGVRLSSHRYLAWDGRGPCPARRDRRLPSDGWWKERPSHDRSEQGARYALVLSIETPDQDVDIWTSVAQQIGIPIEITT